VASPRYQDVLLPRGPEQFSFNDEWRSLASCRTGEGVNPAWWYPDNSRGNGPRRALEICAVCPVKKDCLEYALSAPERHGIWGGMLEHERRNEQRRRDRVAATRDALADKWIR
jgi:WhiB family redox-sensing transcriptional regulator